MYIFFMQKFGKNNPSPFVIIRRVQQNHSNFIRKKTLDNKACNCGTISKTKRKSANLT